MLFGVQLLLIILVVSSLLVAPHNISSFIFIPSECSIILITYKIFISSIVDRHLSFQVWAILNIVIMNTLIHIFWYTVESISFRHFTRIRSSG